MGREGFFVVKVDEKAGRRWVEAKLKGGLEFTI